MRRRFYASMGLLCTALSLILVSASNIAHAAPATNDSVTGNALRISPVRSDITIAPGTSKVVEVFVTNLTGQPITLRGIINDFGATDDETGKPKIYLDENSHAPKHGLKQYIEPVSNITLQAKEQKSVKVTVNIPANAAGGGYFGTVRFAPVSTGSDKSVTLSGSVGSLLLVTVPGDVKEQVGVESFNVVHGDNGKASSFFTSGKGLNAVVRFKNSGNVQEAPFGKLIVKKSGKVVESYEINSSVPRGSVLPDSIRRFDISLGNKTSGFGRYTVEGDFGYGVKGQLITASTSFFVLPLPILIVLIVVLILIVGAVVAFPRMMKSHDRKLLRKLRGKRK